MLTRATFPRLRLGTSALLLTLVGGGFALPFAQPAMAATTTLGTVELSPTPPEQTQAVAPNIVMTFDDSGSMQSNRMNDVPPFTTDASGNWVTGAQDWSGGPWRCANVVDPDHPNAADAAFRATAMNGVYYNPNITYSPPMNADGTTFPNADATLNGVWVDGITVNRPLSPATADTSATYTNNPDLDKPANTTISNLLGTKTTDWWGNVTDNRWKCGTGSAASGGGGDMWGGSSPMDGQAHTLSDGTTVTYPANGPYYYRLRKDVTINVDAAGTPASTADLQALYKSSNWEAVPVPTSQYQNFANWFAYYRTRNQMARSSLSRVFGTLGGKTNSGGFGSNIRMAWQNLNSGTYKLPSTAIISELIDAAGCTPTDSTASPSGAQSPSGTSTPPNCYRSAFFNWLFQVPASGGTPTRSAANRAGTFFTRGNGNTDSTGNLQDPYWQPPSNGASTGKELACRQNYHMLVTDGLWNGGSDGPNTSTLTLPSNITTLPDGVAFPGTSTAGVTSIYAQQSDAQGGGLSSLSDIAFNFWAKNLRPDLYKPANKQMVAPYLPDTKTGVVTSSSNSGSTVAATNVNQEIYFNPKNDPATWPHMSEYLVGLGVNGQLNFSNDTDCTAGSSDGSDACMLRKGQTNSSGAVGWPAPNGSGGGLSANIDDTWHAALAGRGQFFNAGSPQDLVNQLSTILKNITARAAQPAVAAVNASVLTLGALSFNTGYSSVDWSGVLQGVTLNTDGTLASTVWDAGSILTNSTTPANRQILTAYKDSTGAIKGMAFRNNAAFDSTEQAGLNAPASSDTTNDTLANRVDYLRGVRTQEANGVMRQRNTLLGAIISSQAVYVSYPSSGYNSSWPAGSPEAGSSAQTYDDFVSSNANRAGTVYVGANDGMLHAFDASLICSAKDGSGNCISYGPGQSATAGQERWAYVPRAVYANLGNLTSRTNFNYQPTVDGTPVVRDVFFSDNKWHTILVGGLRLGGRGVYALDVTDPTAVKESSASTSVLWEFDADLAAVSGTGDPGNLGYTYGQPNIGRLANGKWVVLVPAGYYPDCSQSDKPANCTTFGAASNTYSSLFVLDAQTGAMITELKTPTTITGVTSFGLSSPVLGDYNNDQIDDVAFAGDLNGNLWRFDLSNSDPTKWSVTLAFQPATQGAQPITVMPRLFPDPATNRFIVVFGTGKYLGVGDNTSNGVAVQSVYGIRDKLGSDGVTPATITRSLLQSQTLSETTINDTSNANNGATLRSLTSNAVTASQGGWYFDLKTVSGSTVTDAGERVVVTPAAIFSTNTAIISTLIPSSTDPCNPTIQGSIMLIDATSGGAGSGVSMLGGQPYVGARTNNVRTSGTIPVTTTLGGGATILPGVTLTGKSKNPDQPFTGDSPVWRRRSWTILRL